ncbi:hypothetical protein D9M69_541820 [compost metagenome]
MTIKVFLRFRDFLGKHPMHCHNLIHEDHAMMVRWDIEADSSGPSPDRDSDSADSQQPPGKRRNS